MESKYGGFRKNKLEKPPLAAKKQVDEYEILLKKKDDFKERELSPKYKEEKKELPSRNLYGPPYSLQNTSTQKHNATDDLEDILGTY